MLQSFARSSFFLWEGSGLGRENVNRHRRGIASKEATAIFGEPYARAFHLPRAASPAQLIDDFNDLRDSGGANRMALREESAARIDNVDSAEIQGPSREKLRAFA